MKKATLYLRCSKQEQRPEAQEPILRAWAEANGYQVTSVEIESESAFKSGRQAKLKQIIESCKSPSTRPDIVLVQSLDRLSRQGMAHLLQLRETFKFYGVALISKEEAWTAGPDNPYSELLWGVFAWAANYDSKLKAEKIRNGQAYARTHGTKSGKKIGGRGPDKAPRARRGYLLRFAGVPKKLGVGNHA